MPDRRPPRAAPISREKGTRKVATRTIAPPHEAPPAPAAGRRRAPRFRIESARRGSLGPFAVAVAITVVAGLSLYPAMRAPGRLLPALVAAPPSPIEEVVYLPVTPELPPDDSPPRARSAPSTGARVTRRPSPPPDSAPVRRPAMPRDSARIPSLAPGMTRIPPLFPPAGSTRGVPSCIGGCDVGTRRRFGERAPAQTMAERDSVIAERVAAVPDEAGPARPPGTIQVGLPGGGPTREQRRRAAALDADNRARLARIRATLSPAQLDSLRRDSVERARRTPRRP